MTIFSFYESFRALVLHLNANVNKCMSPDHGHEMAEAISPINCIEINLAPEMVNGSDF